MGYRGKIMLVDQFSGSLQGPTSPRGRLSCQTTTETETFPGRVYHMGGLALLICFIKSPSIKVKKQQHSQTLAFTRLNPAPTHTAVYMAACTS